MDKGLVRAIGIALLQAAAVGSAVGGTVLWLRGHNVSTGVVGGLWMMAVLVYGLGWFIARAPAHTNHPGSAVFEQLQMLHRLSATMGIELRGVLLEPQRFDALRAYLNPDNGGGEAPFMEHTSMRGLLIGCKGFGVPVFMRQDPRATRPAPTKVEGNGRA
jgi:hypothetical protein